MSSISEITQEEIHVPARCGICGAAIRSQSELSEHEKLAHSVDYMVLEEN